jgi:small neutral amino acid transporter SnatA (MarC family)
MKENKKFIIRRAIVGIVAIPLVAGVYTLGYALLLALGAQPNNSVEGVWSIGLQIGITVAIAFTFAKQIMRYTDTV